MTGFPPGFLPAQAARLGGCTRSQLGHWRRSGVIAPSEAGGRYSFRDLVGLRVVVSLLEAGLPMVRVRSALEVLRAAGGGSGEVAGGGSGEVAGGGSGEVAGGASGEVAGGGSGEVAGGGSGEVAGDDLAGLRIVTDGVTVFACYDDGQILDALGRGQLALFVAVDRFAAALDADVEAFTQERDAFLAHLRDESEAADG